MLGVIVNTIAVIIGSLIGILFQKGIPDKIKQPVMTAIGACTVFIGLQGALKGENTLVAILSMVFGGAIGTILDIDGRLQRAGQKFIRPGKPAADAGAAAVPGASTAAEGFVTACLLWCVGAMTILGSLQAGLTGDNSMLYTKSVLDFISSIVLASSLGIGVLFASVFVFVFQGSLALLAGVLSPLLASSLNEITCAGSLVILLLGFNLLGIGKFKVADYLPAILLAPFFVWLLGFLPI